MWMKIDDGLHAHRKTRAVTKSEPSKTRDAAPMGLWVLAGSWAAQNGTDGWVPEDELDRFDSEWQALAARLVRAGYWWPSERDGERGYGFNDWLDYNPESEAASRSGSFGNHVRWHANRGMVDPECEHCPQEPDNPDIPAHNDPESGCDIGGRSGGESGSESRSIALPVPTRPEPDPTRPLARDVALRSGGDNAPTAQALVAEWIDHCAEPPPGRVKGQVAKELKALLDEGIDPHRIRAALAEWNRKGLHPSTLASVVHEIGNRKPQQRRGDIDWDAAFARAAARTEGAQP